MRRLAAFILAALAAAGCGENSGVRTYRFALLPKMLNNPVFNYGKIAAEKTARKIEAEEGVKIEVIWSAPLNADAAEQASMVERYAAQKVDGISLACNEAGALKKAIDAAVDRGIPVMTFDSDSPKSKRACYYGTDDLECGRLLAEHVGRLIGGRGKVVIQTGSQGAPNLELRVKGVKDTLAGKFPDVEVTQILFCNDDIAKAVTDIASTLSANPDTAGLVLVGGWALFGRDALGPVDPSKTKVVSVDALPEMWKYVESGKCQVLLGQNLWGWGEQSIRLLKTIADGGKVEAGPVGRISASLDVVTAENLEAYKKQWKERFGE